MKIILNNLGKGLLLLTLFMLSLSGFAQNAFNVRLANASSPTTSTFEVDLMLDVLPAEGLRVSSVSTGIFYDPAILNGATPCTTANCASWTMIANTKDPLLTTLNNPTLTNRAGTGGVSVGHLRVVMTNLVGSSSIDVPQGSYRVGRFRFTSPSPFLANSNARLYLSPNNSGGNQNTVVVYYPFGQPTPQAASSTTATGLNMPLALSHNSVANSVTLMLNQQLTCATSGSFTQTAPSCAGASNGTATITLAPVPSNLAASYVLDGGSPVSVTLSAAGAFTITELTSGSHTLSVSGEAACTTPVSVPFTVDAGATPTVNTTTISACGSYTWADTGTTYSTSGTYTGTTTNCVTEQLVLTITPNTTNTTTISACGSYTWANNNTTYTASGTYTGTTTNCVTEELVLTITPATTNTTTISACGSYTWANNNTTYSASGTYTGTTTNCVTEQLVLTITPNTTNTTTISACDSYTWANNNTTYSASGTYTGTTTNCVTEQLVLTITPATTNTTTISACGSYTWANNNTTYSASGTYTGTTTNCVTEQLVLTITPNTTNTTTISACGSYTWANNNTTYSASGTYTGTTTNCVTEQLVLTITPNSTNTTTISACGSYTWANNNTTYSASGTYTGTTTNCVTEQLVLTITPATTNTTTISACGSYTWANNNTTYSASGTYTGTTTNCVTEQLVLTITPATTNTTTISACGSYTWANNGQTYSASGTYTGTTTNCVTEQLVLTINNATTNGNLTITAAGSYTWNTPTGSGLTYTASGIYTATTLNGNGCQNVATLNLTITTGTTTVNTFNVGTNCGATISNLSVTITATAVTGAPSYTFRVTNMATNAVTVISRPVNSFALTNVAGITLGTQYQIEVSVNGGANYGAPCTVFTPTPNSSIGAQCGTTLTSMTQWVNATYVANVTGYRFRVTNNATSNSVTYEALGGQNKFNFSQLPAAFVTFGTTYFVEVSLKNTDGTFLPFSGGCDITTAPFPTSELVLSQCNITATSNTQAINAVIISGATGYRFNLVNSSLGYNFSVDKAVNNFTLSNFSGLVAGTTYTVRVAVRINGVWGPLTGKPCNITTPGTAPTSPNPTKIGESNIFAAVAYPNPFAANFMFDVQTTAQATVQIRVYDMLGKLVENRNVEVSDVNATQFGDNYPSGVYNVIVSQGENTKSIRVIKR